MVEPSSRFGVYVHWPFCKAKCPYCDFNSHVRHQGVDQAEFVKSYLAEIQFTRALTGQRRIDTVFFGGGTPSLMDPLTIETILGALDREWGLASDAEITMEANPTSVEAERFKSYRSIGINRLSLGVQSLRDDALKWLGRQHSASEAMAAADLARKIFPRMSFDLIYARQGLSVADWGQELSQALAFEPDHLSLYQLTIEEGTAFFKLWDQGHLKELDDDIARDQFDLTQAKTSAAGLPAYEVSNHARPGQEAQHNLIYWRGFEYAGIGPGAHGRIDVDGKRMATATEKHPETWVNMVCKQQHGFVERSELNRQDRADEYLLMSMRLREGMQVSRFELLKQHALDLDRLSVLFDLGFLEQQGDWLRVLPAGVPVLNSILTEVATAITPLKN